MNRFAPRPPAPPPAPDPATPPADGPIVDGEGVPWLDAELAPAAPRLLTEALNPDRLRALAARGWDWARNDLLTLESLLQLGIVALAIVAAVVAARLLHIAAERIFRPIAERRFAPLARNLFESMAWPLLLLLVFVVAQSALTVMGLPSYILRVAVSLTVAWIVIRLATHVITEPFWARTLAVLVFTVAALNIFGLLAPAGRFLDTLGFSMGGGARVSILTLLRGFTIAILLIWGARAISGLARGYIDRLPGLTQSARLLMTKSLQLTLMTVAIVMALSSFGINFTALAVFSGALGLAVGFGLQRIFSNLVAGVILLLDRSIKPGDVIEVSSGLGQANTYGYVKTLGLRYSSVVTRDNHEYLIPNEEFILNKVVNWSLSDRVVRLKKTVRVSYEADIRQAQRLMLEAAAAADRVLSHPRPVCLLSEFGPDCVILEIRFWISDPQNGVNNVTSEVLFAIWDRFQEAGISFPHAQRDLHLRGGAPLEVRMLAPETAPGTPSDEAPDGLTPDNGDAPQGAKPGA